MLLIHGAWHGGWCWSEVASPLRASGHKIETPTLLGLAETSASLTPEIGVETHVAQIVELIGERKNLIVCAHSYGGAVARIVESRVPRAIDAILYLEGAIPPPGQNILDINGPVVSAERLETARRFGDGWRLPPPDPLAVWPGMDAETARWLAERLTDHPLKGFSDRQPEEMDWAGCRHAFVYASDREPQPYQACINSFRDRGWDTVAIRGGHELMVTRPTEVADMLDKLASGEPLPSDYDDVCHSRSNAP